MYRWNPSAHRPMSTKLNAPQLEEYTSTDGDTVRTFYLKSRGKVRIASVSAGDRSWECDSEESMEALLRSEFGIFPMGVGEPQ